MKIINFNDIPSYRFVLCLRDLATKGKILDQGEICELLDVFCKQYWRHDRGKFIGTLFGIGECYEGYTYLFQQQDAARKNLWIILNKLPLDVKKTLIPILIDKSFFCKKFIYFAKEAMNCLSNVDKLSVKFSIPDWCKADKYIPISKEEYYARCDSDVTFSLTTWTQEVDGKTKTCYGDRISDNIRSCIEDINDMAKWQTPAKLVEVCHELCSEGTALSKGDALKLLEVFCQRYWKLEEQQKTTFDNFCALAKNSSLEARTALIPQLMNQSIICNDLVFLAKDLLQELTDDEKKGLKIYIPGWTRNDAYTVISEAEYAYRREKGLKCEKRANLFEGKQISTFYCRPATKHDIVECFYCIMEVALIFGEPSYMFLPSECKTQVLEQ